MNNSTLPSNSSSADFKFFLYTQLATGISLAVLSPITITSNVLLLLTISKDPLKCFRAPATYLIIALALVDLATGLLVEPFFVMYRVASYMQWSSTPGEPYNSLSQIATWISTVVLNTSFLFVLGLIWSQFLAITYPRHHHSVVTTRTIFGFVGFSLVYFTGFALLQFAGVSTFTLLQVDLHLHATPVTILLIIGCGMLLKSFHRYATASREFVVARSQEDRDKIRPLSKQINERQFTIVILLLSGILILCTLPHIITVHIIFYKKQETLQESLDLWAATTLADEMMFLKVALDAFIYAWRLKKYRRSLKLVITCQTHQAESVALEMTTVTNNAQSLSRCH
ncbi:uncharacterized protein LOC110066592 [Orbicella faveolata]|uniref:uncharacterized protein LOC110066592 n=1 Tax=Orbicella faveolata TaxID=48498 RepID=UPI0009E241D1|nr:uncharacterized protein LOC110066592 [Orbicella faveolata]